LLVALAQRVPLLDGFVERTLQPVERVAALAERLSQARVLLFELPPAPIAAADRLRLLVQRPRHLLPLALPGVHLRAQLVGFELLRVQVTLGFLVALAELGDAGLQLRDQLLAGPDAGGRVANAGAAPQPFELLLERLGLLRTLAQRRGELRDPLAPLRELLAQRLVRTGGQRRRRVLGNRVV